MNAFYVSSEVSKNPKLRDKPAVVGSDVEAHNGIVPAKSDLAKKAGIQTGILKVPGLGARSCRSCCR